MKPTRPRVLCISSYYPEHGGGVERIAHEIAEYFAATRQWQTLLAANVTEGTTESAPAHYERLELKCWNGIEAMTGLPLIVPSPLDLARLLIRIRKLDLVIVHDEIYLSNFLGIVWALLVRVPLIVVKHTGIVPLKSRPALNWLLQAVTRHISRPLLRHAARTVFVTEAKRDNYDPERTIKNALVVPNGIDTDGFSLPQHGAPPRNGVVFVGRFIESKGLEILRHIAGTLRDVPLTLVGWGPLSPEDWGHENVRVIRRPSRSVIADMLRQSELALVPSLGEGIPLVALEALSCGTRTMIGAGSTRIASDITCQLISVPIDFDQPEQTAELWSKEIRETLETKDDRAAEEARHAAIEATHSTASMCETYAKLAAEIMKPLRRLERRQRD